MFRLSQHFRGALTDVQTVGVGEPAPDDLDLSQMARAALHYLRGNPDPKRHYECKWSLGPLGIPYCVPHLPPNAYAWDPISLGDTDSRMDTQYANMREMAGEPEPDPVELGVRRRVLGYQRDDGLSYVNPAAACGIVVEGEWAMTWTAAKLLLSLSETYARKPDPRLRRQCRSIFAALKGLALWDGPCAYYPGIAPYRDGEWLREGWCAAHARNYPFIVEPLVRYYRCLGDEEALALAQAFTEGFLAGAQKDQGELRIHPDTGAFEGHVHLHTHAVWGVAHLGAILGEPRYLEWARRVYDYVVAHGTDYGWYPEGIPQREYRAEICVVGDMVSMAAWLAQGGQPQYWDHVERTVRNELRRSQFFVTPEFERLFHEVHADRTSEDVNHALRALRKIQGGFVAQPAFNDWVSFPHNPKLGTAGLYSNGIQMMGCCPPEGMRGLWEAWCGTVQIRPDGVFVNMALTRHHPAAKVTAYEPAAGRMVVEARKAGAYHIRPPSWADPASVRLTRHGKWEQPEWGGPASAYVVCRNVRAHERLEVRWPAPYFTQTFAAKSVAGREQQVRVEWLGNEALSVEPRGEYLPMFGTVVEDVTSHRED